MFAYVATLPFTRPLWDRRHYCTGRAHGHFDPRDTLGHAGLLLLELCLRRANRWSRCFPEFAGVPCPG